MALEEFGRSTKNVRLTFKAWSELRRLKFDLKLGTYTDVFVKLYEIKDKFDLQDHLSSKKPEDIDSNIKKNDKTIVISKDTHDILIELKQKYMQETGSTDRGKNAVSISDVVLHLIEKFNL